MAVTSPLEANVPRRSRISITKFTATVPSKDGPPSLEKRSQVIGQGIYWSMLGRSWITPQVVPQERVAPSNRLVSDDVYRDVVIGQYQHEDLYVDGHDDVNDKDCSTKVSTR